MKKLIVKIDGNEIDNLIAEDDVLARYLLDNASHFPEGYTTEFIDVTEQIEQEATNKEALNYLAATDWMIIREIETSVACPIEVKQLRAEARLKVVR